MNILSQITTASQASTTDARGSVKRFVIATLSFAKAQGFKLTNAQVAELTRANVPNAKTTAGYVHKLHKLNNGLYDYMTMEQATTALDVFDKGEEFAPPKASESVTQN